MGLNIDRSFLFDLKSSMKILIVHLLPLVFCFLCVGTSASKATTTNKTSDEIAYEFPPFLRVYKDGHKIRLMESTFIPATTDSKTGVSSKDVTIVRETGVSARLYLPCSVSNSQVSSKNNKLLPLLIYFHGGGFCIGSAFSPVYLHYVSSLVAHANVVAVSVSYRRVPEHDVPVAHEDSWTALKWVLSHANGDGVESWINKYADFRRVFLAGDSAGANIAHNMAIRAGISKDLHGLKQQPLLGVALVNPYFWGVKPIGREVSLNATMKAKADGLWLNVCPTTSGCDDPLLNPATDPNLSRLGCRRVIVFTAEKDILRDRGWYFYEKLMESGWKGVADIKETKGQDHVFHLTNPNIKEAKVLMKQMTSFLNQLGGL